MFMSWIKDVFKTEKPIIAMCHMQALPGDPYYNKAGGLQDILYKAHHDLLALQKGGVDAVLFSNEFSLPYLTKVGNVTTASMARLIGELRDEIEVPYGVNVLWDPSASLDLAVATGAQFVREIFTGVYASDFGLWNTDCGQVIRHQMAISAEDVKLLFNIVPEAAKYLAKRDISEIAKTTIFNCHPDALCVSGLTAGSETNYDTLTDVKKVSGMVPVFANTGCRTENIKLQLAIADGAIVGTTFKIDGKFENQVDVGRVKEFMSVVHDYRNSLN
jgi:membrane complex biogenesis BtpA family protein